MVGRLLFLLVTIIGSGAIAFISIRSAAAGVDISQDDEPPNSLGTVTANSGKEDYDFDALENFSASEFRSDEIEYTDPMVFIVLQKLRTEFGLPIVPSKVKGALARYWVKNGSQHSAFDRKSTAVDCYIPRGTSRRLFDAANKIPEIGAVGIYPVTNDGRPLFHIDLRSRRGSDLLSWLAKQGGKENNYKWQYTYNMSRTEWDYVGSKFA